MKYQYQLKKEPEESIDEIEIHAQERAELVAEVIDDIFIMKKMRPALEEESIDEIEIEAQQRSELVAEVIDDIFVAKKEKAALEEESIDEINIAAKTTWDDLVVAEDSSFELARKPVSELEVIGVDSFDVQALVRPTLDVEYLDEIIIDIDEKILLERNIKYTEMESVDEIGIAGQPLPEKLDEYITETEIVEETTTTNLKNVNRGGSRTTETVTETTTNNRRNLDNMGRKVIVESSQTTTTKGGRISNNDNMGRKVIVESSQTTTTRGGRTSNNDNMGRKVIVQTSETTTTTTGNRFARGNNDNMGRKVIVESSQTTTTKGARSSNNDNMGRKVIVQTSETTTTTTGNRFGKGNNDNMGRKVIVQSSQTTTTKGGRVSNNDNMGRKVIVESTTVTRGGDSATGASRFSAYKSSANNDNMGRKVIVESTTTRKGETSTGSSRRGTHNAGYGGMSKKVIVETTTTTTSNGGYGAKKGASGYQIENVALNKSGSGSGSSYYKEEKKVTKISGGRKPWEVDNTNGDEVFAGRHPSDEEVSVSTGGNGYTKYSVKKEVKYQPTTTTRGATSSKTSKFSVQRTGN